MFETRDKKEIQVPRPIKSEAFSFKSVLVVRISLLFLFALYVFLPYSCKSKSNADLLTINSFFHNLKIKEFDKAMEYTEAEARELMIKIVKDLSPDIRDMIFSKLELVSIEDENAWYNAKNDNNSKIYIIKYSCNLNIKAESEELRKYIEEAKNGEALFYVKNNKIIKIIDIKGGIFRY